MSEPKKPKSKPDEVDVIPKKVRKSRPKTGGRKKGTPNKTTEDLKRWGLEFLNKHTKTFDDAFKDLPPEKKLEILVSFFPKLLPFYVAKQTESKISFDDDVLKTIKEASDKINNIFKK